MFIKDKTHKLTNNTNIGKEEKVFGLPFVARQISFNIKCTKIERQFHYQNVLIYVDFRPNKFYAV